MLHACGSVTPSNGFLLCTELVDVTVGSCTVSRGFDQRPHALLACSQPVILHRKLLPVYIPKNTKCEVQFHLLLVTYPK